MRAVDFHGYGGPEVLHVEDLPEPHAGPGQVRIRVRAVGVNPFDAKQRSGMIARTAPLTGPVVPGVEAAGVVDELGEGVTGVAVGDAVFGLGSATYAEHAVLRAWAATPASFSPERAAALAVAGETAVRALGVLGLPSGRTVLIHGAAGAVGQAAVQVARADGLRVIGTASERNHDWLRELGAEPVSYGDGLVDRVRRLSPGGVNGVLDTAGSQLDDLLVLVASPEQVVTIANYAAAQGGARFTGGGGDPSAALARVAELAASGRLAVRVARTYDLGEAAAAHEFSESRHSGGKIVLTVG